VAQKCVLQVGPLKQKEYVTDTYWYINRQKRHVYPTACIYSCCAHINNHTVYVHLMTAPTRLLRLLKSNELLTSTTVIPYVIIRAVTRRGTACDLDVVIDSQLSLSAHVAAATAGCPVIKDDRQRFLQKVSKKQFRTVYYNANACG